MVDGARVTEGNVSDLASFILGSGLLAIVFCALALICDAIDQRINDRDETDWDRRNGL